MPGPWKAWKTKGGFPTLPTVPWKSRKKREIPTFPPPGLRGHGKVENRRQVSQFPTAARDDDSRCLSENQKTKERNLAATRPHSLPFSLRSNGTDFMLILRLENA